METLDLRIQKTYQALNQAFESLLQEKEFEKITVTEICEAALIRRPTFYKHFLDKYDFLAFFIKHKMKIIFDGAFQNLDTRRENFFIAVFEELLNQPDNVLFLIFTLQTNTEIMLELESIQKYGQSMLRSYVRGEEKNGEITGIEEYKGQIIMGITIQTVQWYKHNEAKISRQEIIQLYKQTLEKLW